MITIGFLELNSIAKGIQAADMMLKAAEIRLVSARPSCPGKYQILITGEVSAVESALRTGVESAKANVVDRLLIPRVHPQVIEAISMSAMPSSLKALGILEFFSVTGAIIAADAAGTRGHGQGLTEAPGYRHRRKILCHLYRGCGCSGRKCGGRGKNSRNQRYPGGEGRDCTSGQGTVPQPALIRR